MVYSILTEARIKASVADLQPSERAYSVFWTRNGDLEGWTTILDLDIVGAWNGFLFGTKREATTGEIGPSSTITPIDATANERIFFRLKYDKHPKNTNSTNTGKIRFTTTSDPVFDDIKSVTFTVVPDGRWHFYEINMGEVSTWVGNVNNIRFFPCINGARNDEFFLNFFEIGTNIFDFSFDNPNAGLAAKATGALSLGGPITIEKDVNDRLLVNIDGYGDVQLRLMPQTATASIIARDISLQLGKVGIGGYIRAEAYIDDQSTQMIIESGIRAEDSSVTIVHGINSAGFTLGFFDNTGFSIYTTTPGADPIVGFEPLSSYRPTTLEIMALFDNDNILPAFTIDPQTYVVEGGRRDFGTTNRKLSTTIVIEGRNTDFQGQKIQTVGTFDGAGTTLIDMNHPFTDDGELEKIYLNGVANTDGSSKWMILRPKLDGTLTRIAVGSIGATPPLGTNEVLTVEPGVYVTDVSTSDIFVRRGDMLGVYNVDLHTGSFGGSKADAMYYAIDGEATGTFAPGAPDGAGEAGLPMYARGRVTKNKAVVDIDLGNRLNLDTIKIAGFEDTRDLEYNVAIAQSATFSADVFGSHTICYNPSPIIRICFDRPNAAFNLQTLNDDILFAENGIAGFGNGGQGGTGGADADGATYFYVNGDGEFIGTNEFVNQAGERFDFNRDPLGISCFFSSTTLRLDKPIGKAVIYFKEKKNQRSWQIEYALSEGSSGGNGSTPGFSLIPAITATQIDTKRIERPKGFVTTKVDSDASTLLLRNPVLLDTVANDGTRNPQIGDDFNFNAGELGGVNTREQATFLDFQWNRFQWEFDAIRTTGFRWYSDFHWSTKISEFQIFAVSESFESLGDNTQILFSATGDTFTTAEMENTAEQEATYRLGGSPQYLRLIFRPTLRLSITDATVNFEEDQVCFGPEGRIQGSITIEDARRGETGAATPLLITNLTGVTADLQLDIPPDVSSARQLLYFSKLHSAEDITRPDVGPPGRVDFTGDKILREEENIAINAHCWGLLSLVSGTASTFVTENLFVNPGFETGDLTGWALTLIQSGTGVTNSGSHFQVPRVIDIDSPPDEDSLGSFQTGNYVFGVAVDSTIAEHGLTTTSNFPDIEFELNQTVDISEFATQIDQGEAFARFTWRYIAMWAGSGPTVRFIGAPTASGVAANPGTIVDPTYGSNLLKSFGAARTTADSQATNTATVRARLKVGTRFLRMQVDCLMTDGVANFFNQYKLQKLLSDDYELNLELPTKTKAKWYKSWRSGLASSNEITGFTDSHFEPIAASQFVTTTGSTHWYQPFDSGAVGGVPIAGQTQGFSRAYSQNRFDGIQSFRQMTISDPGVLGMQWTGERRLVGFRIMMHHETNNSSFFAQQWPRHFQVEVLRTEADLGETPDLNNPNHFVVAQIYRNAGPELAPTEIQGASSNSDGPYSRITTWLFNTPVETEGMRLMFTRNCDRFERNSHATNVIFGQVTGCPNGNSLILFEWSSSLGIGVGYFVPLESLGYTDLPTDNVIETHIGSANNTATQSYVAVDLGRHHAIDLSSELFELIATTPSQSEFNTTSTLFSGDDTDDPNAVTWAGTSANARWIRFVTNASEQWEDPATLLETTIPGQLLFVDNIPQAQLNQARIYPDLTKVSFHTEGYNSEWQDLGTMLSDNRVSTSIFGSDYPVIALDLGKKYLIANDTDVLRKRHDVVGPRPNLPPNGVDKLFWNGNSESFWTYAATPSAGTGDPRAIPYRTFGAGVPDYGVRWLAVKIAAKLAVVPTVGSPPKEYNFETPGLTLYYIRIKPRSPQVFTENARWFSNSKSVLSDVSTFKFALGEPITILNGKDYGSAAGSTGNSSTLTANNLGDPYRAFDGKFDELGADLDIWGVQVRDVVTGQTVSANNFPHSIWRVFRNTQTGVYHSREVKAIKIKGYNEQFYPTHFSFQKLRLNANGSVRDPNLNSSWETIADSTFTDIDTFQEGFGFTHIFPEVVEAKGIRVRITASEYPDDSVESQVDPDTGQVNQTNPDVSGPQTRVSEIVIYQEKVEVSQLEGTIETNHMLSATVSSNTEVSDRGIGFIKDNDIGSYWQSTGFSDTINIALSSPKPITRLEWEKDPNLAAQSAAAGTNAPYNFTLKGVVAGLTQTLLVGSGIEGTTFSGTLIGAPVTASNFTFEVSDVQGRHEDANSIIISEFRLVEVFEQSTPLATIEPSDVRRPGGTNNFSTRILYAANADAITKVTADGWDGNNDSVWSKRDFFSLWVYINDASLLDTSYGNFKLGNDSETYYRWDFKSMGLQTGWNELKLQFRTADFTSPVEFQPGFQYSSNTGESKVDFMTGDVVVTTNVDGSFSQRVVQSPGIRFFEMELRGTKGAAELEIILDDFRFIRNRYDDVCKFLPSLYLNNSEAFTIFLEGLDIASGTVEFWFQPDWDSGGRLAEDRSIIAAIFRIMRPDGKFLSLFYRPDQGFIPMIYDGKNLYQFVTNVSQYRFEKFDTMHVALVWDAERRVRSSTADNASLALFINGKPVFGTDETWDAVREGGASVVMGGEVGQRFAATPDNSTALLFTAVPTQPSKNTASSWALLENLKIYNYPKTDFSDIYDEDLERIQLVNPSEMLEISIDGVNFVGVGSAELPLTVQDVPAGGSVTVYIRTIIPRNLTGDEKRDASLMVRWKTPLQDCN
jgi:hypothetical protein